MNVTVLGHACARAALSAAASVISGGDEQEGPGNQFDGDVGSVVLAVRARLVGVGQWLAAEKPRRAARRQAADDEVPGDGRHDCPDGDWCVDRGQHGRFASAGHTATRESPHLVSPERT
jgi:hypothetical protein